MKRVLLLASLFVLAWSSLAPHAGAQQLVRAVPEVGEPGDLVILRGTNLGATTSVEFQAIVGGFTGVWTVSALPLSVSATEVHVRVPLINAFVPFGSSPFGTVRVTPPAGDLDFFYMEQTSGALSTPGIGTTQASGIGKPVISFVAKTAAQIPAAGSTGISLWIENATPGSVAIAVIGAPAAPPYLPIGDGELVLQTSGMIVLAGAVVGASGDAKWASPPIPPTATGTVVLQWGMLEAGSGQLAVSNGLQVVL